MLLLSLLIFGSFVAAVLPVLIGGIAILGAFTMLRVLTEFTGVSTGEGDGAARSRSPGRAPARVMTLMANTESRTVAERVDSDFAGQDGSLARLFVSGADPIRPCGVRERAG